MKNANDAAVLFLFYSLRPEILYLSKKWIKMNVFRTKICLDTSILPTSISYYGRGMLLSLYRQILREFVPYPGRFLISRCYEKCRWRCAVSIFD